jgi:GNAT superfamily N-acetyltransferase
MTIRTARPSDAPALAELMAQLGYPTSEDQMARRLRAIADEKHFVTFVAVENGDVVGMAGASVAPFYEKDGLCCRLLALAVLDEHRRRGIGEALVDQVEEWARGRGAVDVRLNSAHHRADAHAFYERLGYESTGLRFRKELGELP